MPWDTSAQTEDLLPRTESPKRECVSILGSGFFSILISALSLIYVNLRQKQENYQLVPPHVFSLKYHKSVIII
jgi:hypothetical protein